MPGSGSRATAYRYRDEGVAVLAAQAPDLHEALERAKAQGLSHLILDGKVIDTDRVTEPKLSRKGKQIDAWYAGKTHDFGGLIQALMNPRGIPLWVSEVMPGSVHDITAARALVLAILAPHLNDLPVLADGGYEGAGHGVLVPVKKPKDTATNWTRKPDVQQAAARPALPRGARLRAPGHPGENTPARDDQPSPDHRPGPRRTRPHPIRTQDDHAIVAEITSVRRFGRQEPVSQGE